jgi:hypothetical protein
MEAYADACRRQDLDAGYGSEPKQLHVPPPRGWRSEVYEDEVY